MVLSEKEKNGAFKILSLLSDTEVVSLAKTVTKSQIIIETREGKNVGFFSLPIMHRTSLVSIIVHGLCRPCFLSWAYVRQGVYFWAYGTPGVSFFGVFVRN